MRRTLGMALSFTLPLLVGGAVLAVMIAGGNEDAEGWMRAASFTVLPAALGNAAAAWLLAYRAGARPPANAGMTLLRALLTFLLALPLTWLFATLAIGAQDTDFAAAAITAAVVALFAGVMGIVPMTLLQALAYHVTLDRRTA